MALLLRISLFRDKFFKATKEITISYFSTILVSAMLIDIK